MSEIKFSHEYPRRIKAAVIGCGGHSQRNILPALQYAPVELVALCDLDHERAHAASRSFGATHTYTDYREMLEKERPDAAFVVLNYDEHGHPRYPRVAMASLHAGAHVWIEKPPAASSEEIRKMIQATHETGKFVGVGFKKMFAPANTKAKEIISRPEFGAITTITARYPQSLPDLEHRSDDKKMVGFLNHIVHPYSVLRYLGGPIESVTVEREARSGATITLLRYANGAVGSLHLSAGQADTAPKERTEIVGEGGNIVVDNNIRVTYHRPGGSVGPYGRTGTFYGPDETAALTWEPEFSLGQLYNKGLFLLGYAPEIAYFSRCVLENQAPAIGNLEDALELMKIYEAYRQPEGQKIVLPTA